MQTTGSICVATPADTHLLSTYLFIIKPRSVSTKNRVESKDFLARRIESSHTHTHEISKVSTFKERGTSGSSKICNLRSLTISQAIVVSTYVSTAVQIHWAWSKCSVTGYWLWWCMYECCKYKYKSVRTQLLRATFIYLLRARRWIMPFLETLFSQVDRAMEGVCSR